MIKTVQVFHMHNVLVKNWLTRFTPPQFFVKRIAFCALYLTRFMILCEQMTYEHNLANK